MPVLRRYVSFFLLAFTASGTLHAQMSRDEAREALRNQPELSRSFPSIPDLFEHHSRGEIFMIFAHADDELTVSAQVAALQRRHPERTVRWLLVSDNGRGRIAPGTCENLSPSECRFREAAAAAQCLGLTAPEPMNLPDGGLLAIPDLADRIEQKISSLARAPILGIFSHDEAGLYGHPDHVAVHDALRTLRRRHKRPLMAVALTEFQISQMPRIEPGASRDLPSIEYDYRLSEEDIRRVSCATRAHRSQWPTLERLLLGLSPEEFWQASPAQFFHRY